MTYLSLHDGGVLFSFKHGEFFGGLESEILYKNGADIMANHLLARNTIWLKVNVFFLYITTIYEMIIYCSE